MKNLMITCFLLVSAVSAQAGSDSCAGKKLYYSFVRADLGMNPPIGMKIGSLTIVSDAKVLLDQEILAHVGQHTISEYAVEFSDVEVIQSEGNQWQGSSVSKRTARLLKVNPFHPLEREEIASETVVCQKNWRMAI